MREIVFDTETTGFDAEGADRVVEIGMIELINYMPTDRRFHVYINPERPMPAEAFAVHGLGDDFLRDKPKFAQIVDDMLAFIGDDAPLIAHNATFDFRFLNAELRRLGRATLSMDRMIDTLEMAKARFPGSKATLDALCRRFGVDNSGRDLHGALIDADLLAGVYLELIGGRQPDLVLDQPAQADDQPKPETLAAQPTHSLARPRPLPARLSAAEAEAHSALVARIGDKALWLNYQT